MREKLVIFVVINVLWDLKSGLIISLTVWSCLVTALPARAETFSQKISVTESSNQERQSNWTSEIIQSQINIEPGRATRSGSSYLGIGVNIGLDGGTNLGNDTFTVISKIGLTDSLSFRPSALIEEEITFLFPLTVDFYRREVREADLSIAPYLGGGLAIDTGEGDNVGLLISGGLDIPLSPKFTANTAINIKFIDNTAVGWILGVGYNF